MATGGKSFSEFADTLSFVTPSTAPPSTASSSSSSFRLFGGWGSTASSTPPTQLEAFTPAGQEADIDLESQGLMGMAKKSLSVVSSGARSVVQRTQERVEETTQALNPQRLVYFGIFAFMGAVLMMLAFAFLPVLVFAPQKFALLFTLSSVFLLGSLAILRGFPALLSYLTGKERLPYFVAYVVTLLGTLYTTLMARSYFLTLFMVGGQIFALFVLLVSYLPGGMRFLGFLKDLLVSMAKRLFRSGSGETLPI